MARHSESRLALYYSMRIPSYLVDLLWIGNGSNLIANEFGLREMELVQRVK